MVDSYGTNDGFNAYCDARGITHTHSGTQITAARLVASEWIDSRFRHRWPGDKIGNREQVRDWPRAGAVDVNGDVISNTGYPVEVENATYLAALRELTTTGSLSRDYTPPQYKRASVDGAVSVEYNIMNGSYDSQTMFQIINETLSTILTDSGKSSALSGSLTRA